MNVQALIKSIEKTTSKWTKKKRREERQSAARINRRYAMTSSWRVTLKEAVLDELPDAYKQAAGSLNAANARQIYYCVRPGVVSACEKPLDYNYLCVLLDEFVADHTTTTADWNVCYDAKWTGTKIDPGPEELSGHGFGLNRLSGPK